MENGIQIKGKSVEDAVAMAAKELNTSKDNIEYIVLEESNKTLFSILSPRYAIIQAKVIDLTKVKKEEKVNDFITEKKEENRIEEIEELDENTKIEIEKILNKFLDDFEKVQNIKTERKISFDGKAVNVSLTGGEAAFLIGYRGETLESMQRIITLTVLKQIKRRVIIQLNIENYREKREESLTILANRIAKNVVKTGKNKTLEPMIAYERKIIHNALKDHPKVTTKSVGEEPHRKTIIMLKK